jgi:hypothetical protein
MGRIMVGGRGWVREGVSHYILLAWEMNGICGELGKERQMSLLL